MNRKSQVLMNADVVPPNAQSIFVARLIRSGALFTSHSPTVVLMIQSHRRHQLLLSGLMNFPAAHVMAARDDAGLDAFRNPGAHDKISNLSFDADQIAGPNPEPLRMRRMQPERIRVCDFI